MLWLWKEGESKVERNWFSVSANGKNVPASSLATQCLFARFCICVRGSSWRVELRHDVFTQAPFPNVPPDDPNLIFTGWESTTPPHPTYAHFLVTSVLLFLKIKTGTSVCRQKMERPLVTSQQLPVTLVVFNYFSLTTKRQDNESIATSKHLSTWLCCEGKDAVSSGCLKWPTHHPCLPHTPALLRYTLQLQKASTHTHTHCGATPLHFAAAEGEYMHNVISQHT